MAHHLTKETMGQSDLVLYEQGSVTFDEIGMHVGNDLSYDEWESIGDSLASANEQSDLAFMWSWGDWLNYGEWQYGEMYSQAIERTRKAPSTLANYKWVAGKIPKELRGLPNLSQEHYVKVARLNDVEIQRQLLTMASQDNWTARGELAQAILSLDSGNQNGKVSDHPKPGMSRDEIDTLQQERYMLEQKAIELQIENELLQGQIAEAQSYLETTLEKADSETKPGLEKVIHTLQSEINRQAIQLIKQVIAFYRSGNTSAMVDALDQLCEIMEDI